MSGTNTTRRQVSADRELSEHYTSAVGGRGQSYEPMVTGGDNAPEIGIMSPWRCAARRRFVEVEQILATLDVDARRVLRLVYGHGTDALSDATDDDGHPLAGKPTGLVAGKNNRPDPLGLLRVALSPTWGHGTYTRLAVGQHRALRAFAKRYPGRTPSLDAVLDYLAHEAGRGDASAGMLAELRNECEAARDGALEAFATARATWAAERAKARQETNAAEQKASEETLERAKAQRTHRGPMGDLTDEQRERLRSAALSYLAIVKEDEAVDLEVAS